MKVLALLSMFVIPAVSSIAMAQTKAAGYGHVEVTQIKPLESDAIWQRERSAPVRYPRELVVNNIAGCAVFDVAVDSNGETSDINLVSAVPQRGIEAPAAALVAEWEWQNISDKPDTAENKRVRLDFCMARGTQEAVIEQCKAQAKYECQ